MNNNNNEIDGGLEQTEYSWCMKPSRWLLLLKERPIACNLVIDASLLSVVVRKD